MAHAWSPQFEWERQVSSQVPMHTSGIGTIKLFMEEKSKILFLFPSFIISLIFFIVIRLVFLVLAFF